MPAYFLVDIREIRDEAKMERYRAQVSPVVEKFGGRYLVVGGPFEKVEGSNKPVFPVLIEFPSMDQAHRWYDSGDYRELKKLRLEASESNAFFMDGRPKS